MWYCIKESIIFWGNNIDVRQISVICDVIIYAEEEDEIKVYFNGQVYQHQWFILSFSYFQN